MPRHLTVAERLAAGDKNVLLEDIAATSTWDRFLVEQAVYAIALDRGEFSANDLRDLLPDLAHGFLGAVINSLRNGGVIAHTGRAVPSTAPATHGHRLAIWALTPKGHAIAATRTARKETAA